MDLPEGPTQSGLSLEKLERLYSVLSLQERHELSQGLLTAAGPGGEVMIRMLKDPPVSFREGQKMTKNQGDSPAQGPRVCPAEHAGWLSTSWRKVIHNPRRMLRGLVRPGDTVVDLGCGPGFFSLPLAELVGKEGLVVAVDLQDEMLQKLRVRLSKLVLPPGSTFTDARRLRLAS